MQSECLFKASGSKFDRIFVPERAVMRSEKADLKSKRAPKETVLLNMEVGLHKHVVAQSPLSMEVGGN